jgi:hypothetical protein
VAQASVELLRGTGGEMVSKQLRHLTEPADCQALVDLAPGSLAGSTRCSTPAATAYLNRLDDINDEEADPAPATRSTSSGGMKGVVACGGR